MAATFPGGVKVFTTKAAGEQIASAHINDLQAEVVAVETELKKTTGSVVDHGALTGLTDNDHPQYLLAERYAVKAYRDATTFTLTTSGTLYAVPLNQESYDTHAQHDNTTNPSRLTCKKAGMYLVLGTVTFGVNSTGNRDVLIQKNGGSYLGQQRLSANASGTTSCNAIAIAILAVNDYVELVARQYSGGSLDLYYADDMNNQLVMVRLGD